MTGNLKVVAYDTHGNWNAPLQPPDRTDLSPLVKWFVFFHHPRHPGEMVTPEINAFLTVQEPLGHSDVKTTMMYPFVFNRVGRDVKSPTDTL